MKVKFFDLQKAKKIIEKNKATDADFFMLGYNAPLFENGRYVYKEEDVQLVGEKQALKLSNIEHTITMTPTIEWSRFNDEGDCEAVEDEPCYFTAHVDDEN